METKSGRVALRTKTNRRPKKAGTRPYDAWLSDPRWKVIENGIKSLVLNGDIEERTDRYYVVGYLCKLLSETFPRK